MNKRKLSRLLVAARIELAPSGPAHFDSRVMRAVDREGKPAAASLFDQLALLFPRLALAAVVVIGLCVGSDYLLTSPDLPNLAEGVAQISDQWLFTGSDL